MVVLTCRSLVSADVRADVSHSVSDGGVVGGGGGSDAGDISCDANGDVSRVL